MNEQSDAKFEMYIDHLRAEVERLTAELAEMTEDRDSENRWAKEYFDHWNTSKAEVERLKNLCIIASQTMTVIDEWMGAASTRQAAMDSMWRLNRALEQNGFPYENRHILDWRGSVLHELNDAGFYPNSDNAYAADTRFVYDPDAPAGHRIFGNAVGPTIKEVVAENQRLTAENARMKAKLEEIKDYAGPESQDIDDGWSHIYDLASEALKGGAS